jgi:hypothetical protein
MAIDAISSISPIMSSAMVQQSRPAQATPRAEDSAAQENDARRVASAESGASPAYQAAPDQAGSASSVGTRVNVQAVAPDAETALRASSAEIARAYSGDTTPADMRAASEAYRVESGARSDLQQQDNGMRNVDVLA